MAAINKSLCFRSSASVKSPNLNLKLIVNRTLTPKFSHAFYSSPYTSIIRGITPTQIVEAVLVHIGGEPIHDPLALLYKNASDNRLLEIANNAATNPLEAVQSFEFNKPHDSITSVEQARNYLLHSLLSEKNPANVLFNAAYNTNTDF